MSPPEDRDGESSAKPGPLVPPGGPPPDSAPSAQPAHPSAHPYSGQPPPGQFGGSPYPEPYGGRVLPRPSQAMAGWALGLSLVFCVPLLPVVGVILGIVVLARCRDGRDHGKGLAISAIVIGALVLVGQIVFVVLGVVEGIREGLDSTTRDENGEVVESGDMLPTKLRVGDCFDDPALMGAGTEPVEAGVITGVPCAEPHNFEVYAIFDMKDDDDGYPGQSAIDQRAVKCVHEFKRFIGLSYAKSDLEFSYYFPTSVSWRILGDRAITCVAWDPRDERLTGSLENAKR